MNKTAQTMKQRTVAAARAAKDFVRDFALFLSAAVAVAAFSASTPAEPKKPADLKPLPHYGELARKLAEIIPACHVLGVELDDSVSIKAWTNLLASYDPTRHVFLQSDIDRFASMRTRIDDAMRSGDVSFAFDIYRTYADSLAGCMDFVTNLVATNKFEFPEGEKSQIQRKDAEWPRDAAERRDLWTKRIKNEILVQVLARRLDAEEAAAKKAKKKGKPDAAGKDAAEKPGPAPDSQEFFAESVEIARTNVLKRYRQFALIMAEPDEDAVMQRFVNSVASAYDPHTAYMSPASSEDFEQSMSLVLCGVGAVLQMDDGALKITEIMPGGPIDRDKRIKRGDKIVGVGQGATNEVEDIMYRPMNKTIRKIRGPKGTQVTLEIIPRSDSSGATRRRYTLVRDAIKLEDEAATGRVEYVECEGGAKMKLGYIVLPSFYGTMGKSPDEEGYRSCTEDVRRELAKLEAQGIEALALDLRGNGGGSLREAVSLVSVFVRKGPVVQVREANRLGMLRCENNGYKVFDKPMIVLIDRASASASEIVAGALQDYGRAIVVGDDQSHGKGTVQTVLPLGESKFGTIKVTTARFYRINGSSTQVKGVHSDIVLPSVLGELDIGEDKLPGALPWSRVLPASYRKAWNMREYVEPLRADSEKRLASNPKWERHIRAVHYLRDASKRIFVPIGYNERLALMREERKMREAADDSAASLLLDEDPPQDEEEDFNDEAEEADEGREDQAAAAPDDAKDAKDAKEDKDAKDNDGKPSSRRRKRRLSTIPEKNDIVLEEALKILSGLVERNGGAVMRSPRRRPALDAVLDGDFL